MIKNLISLLALLIFACGSGTNKNCYKTIHIFRTPQTFNFFELRINKDYRYLDTVGIITPTPLAYLITEYCAKLDTVHFEIRINDRDTAFNYVFNKNDSLLIGLNSDKRFILFNESEYILRED